MKTTSTKLIAVAAAILMASASAFAAVKNGASLKGTDYTKGGNNAKGGGVIAWNSFSSLDPTAFSHDLSSSDLTVLKDGDYLVAVTVPLSTINAVRNTHRADLLVNGTAVPTAVGESSYIRFADGHNESSDHFAVLVPLKANDVLTVKTTPTAQTGAESFIGTCSLYAELVEGDRNVFSASATEIQSGVELNVEPDIGDQGLVWTSARKGSAYTHSDGDAEITIKDVGNYMVYVNVPLRGNILRASVGLSLNLDEEYIWGARGQQGYIRNAGSHQDASIHFSGMIRAEAGQVLTVITEQLAAPGSIKVQANRAASIFIEKVRNDGLFSDSFTGTTAGENLNPNNKTALSLVGDGESLDIIDNTTYANEGDNEENIVIKKAGNYLLSFNSTFTGGNARANPRVTVEVNGDVVPGATSLSHYNRHASGHDEVTGSFVALLSDLAVDDVVTVSVQREGNGGTVTSPEGGRVALQAKATHETAAGDQSPPRFSSFSGGLSGFSAALVDSGLKLDAATLKATLNGEVVDVTVDSANGVNAISYAFPTFPSTGSEHALNIAFNDTGGNAHSKDFAFTVTTEYKTISPALSMSDVNKDKGGFRVNLSQISAIQTEGPVEIHGNQWVNAEKQLRGEFLNPNEVDDDDNPLPYLNEADPDAWEGWSIAPADVDYVNMNQDEGGSVGNFGEDQMFPNIPGWGDSTDGIAGEFLTVLHLKKGYQTLGVSSDDGFRATVGLNFHDMEAQQIGLFNGNRGINAASNPSLFNIVVTEEGYYPLRVLWWEGGGGANIEIFSIEDGEKVLVNDPDNADAIKAYNIGNSTGRSYFSSVSPTPDDTFATENSISATIVEGGTKAKSGSIKVLFNGEEVAASIQSADGVVTVTAEPDGGLGIGSHTAKIVFTETTDPETERSFEWSFEVTAFSNKMRDLVDGQPNPIAYWDFDFAVVPDLTFEHVFNLESVMTNAKYTEDKGGHTGETGDHAMDFLTTGANLLVPDGEFLNIASAFDKISVSLWQKNHTTPNSSSFWGYSPSSNNGFRGIQAHIPWGNLQIFFDTAGCCNVATQRINLAVDANHEWTEWHHYVFVKDKGHKSIWIDGTLFHEGDNSSVLPSDFDFLYIGGNQTGANSVSGIIDDFAVFASALTEEQIIALAEGNTDILPEKREIVVPQPDIPILLSKSPTGAGPVGEDEISLRFRGVDFTDLSITVNDTAVDPTITSDAMFSTITADGAFSLGENVITVSWDGESETWNYFQFSVAEGQTGLASYSVQTVGAVPGPWTFEGVWVSEGSVAGCGGPYHDFLTSPNYIVSADGEVTFNFEHRHAFEGAMWDSGQLWIRVNGGEYADVGTDAFTANGYTDIAIIGNGIAKGQNGFGNTSAGYADGSYITTTANLGSFAAGDAISVRFVALYDDCATGVNPNWVIAGVSSDQMAIKPIEGGLVAHWPMNEGSGDVFRDVVGRFDGFLPLGLDGAQTEVSWGEGPPTQANSVEFSGANSFIATGFPGIGGSEPRTVAFWVRTTDADAYFVSWGANVTAQKWHIRANGASGVMRTEYAGGQNFATTSIIDGEWHHVASVVPNGATEGEQILHYIDGVLDPRAGGANQIIDTAIPTDAVLDWTNFGGAVAYPVHIGARMNANLNSMLDGSIADVRIYNQGLSEDQIRAIFEGEAESPALATDKASYMSGEDITVNFSNGLGNPKDWVGLYQPQHVPGPDGSTRWAYVSGSGTAGEGLTDGTITFAGGLPAGSYVARFFENDGYTQIADAVAFTVIDPPGVSTSKAKYGPGESITINFSDGPGNPKDWVGLYRPDMTPGDVGSLVWSYVSGTTTAGDGLTDGSVTFANGMAVGDYKAIYFENDGYAQLASTTFSVAAAELPAGVIFAEDFDGLALGPWVSDSESGGDGTDWTATAPTGWVTATGDGHGATAGGDTVTEFDGWTFVDPVTWNTTAGQERSQFTKGSGAIAVADSDEFDDKADAGFNASLSTPAIDISSSAAGSLVLTYDSSWRQEPQNGKVTVAFDGGTAVTLLELTPDTPTAYNETVSLNLDNPAGAQTAVISWEKQGHNNWWWAIDNITVTVKVDGLSSVVAGLSTQALESLVAHYDGKNGVKTDGASVVSWTPIDANGDSLDGMIVTSTQRGGGAPELITYDGSGKLTFDDTDVGADGRYLEGALSNAESKEFTVFWVGNYSADAPFATSGAYVYKIGINNTSHQRDDGAGGFVVEQYNGTTYAGDDITAHDGVTTVWSTVLTADSHAFYANGENLNVAGTPSNNVQANASMIIGAYSSSGYDFVGEVEQLIIFGSALSDADRELVEGYLGVSAEPSPLFGDNFDSDSSGNWAVHKSTDDTAVTFGYDYSADGIPAAPNSDGTTIGIKFETNIADPTGAEAVSISPAGGNFTGDYQLNFDMWINANGPFPGGGGGSTEFFTAGVGTTGDHLQWAADTADGAWFGVTGEGGSGNSGDFRAHIGGTPQAAEGGAYAAGTTADSRNNNNAHYADAFPGQSPPAAQTAAFPDKQTGAVANGAVGFAWRQVTITKIGDSVTWAIDGVTIATLEQALGAFTTEGNIFVGYYDAFSSVSDNQATSFGLVDNIRVVEIQTTLPPALSIVNNGDGSVTVTFEGTLQAANSVNGPWADVEGAVSPQIIPASEAMQFGRAVK